MRKSRKLLLEQWQPTGVRCELAVVGNLQQRALFAGGCVLSGKRLESALLRIQPFPMLNETGKDQESYSELKKMGLEITALHDPPCLAVRA